MLIRDGAFLEFFSPHFVPGLLDTLHGNHFDFSAHNIYAMACGVDDC